MISKICPQCGKEFITTSKAQKLCSRACAFASMSRKVHVSCPVCGKDMYIHKGEKKCCSLKCAGIALHRSTVKTAICPVCSKSFELKSKGMRFCSVECARVGKRKVSPVFTADQKKNLANDLRSSGRMIGSDR